ncbi:MAG: SlyX family protein [Pseudohongiellaceae bacterium]
MEEKFIELEMKISYQEDLLSDLNEIVIKQQRHLDEVSRELSLLKDQLQEALERGSAQGDLAHNEQPPHY